MLLRKSKVNRLGVNRQTLLPDRLGQSCRTAEEGSDLGPKRRLPSRQILAGLDRHPQPPVHRLPVRATENGAGAEKSERIVRLPGVVDRDVPEHVFADLLREEDVHAQEVRVGLCSFDFLEEGLEPAEGGSVTADPEEFDTLEGP